MTGRRPHVFNFIRLEGPRRAVYPFDTRLVGVSLDEVDFVSAVGAALND